MGSDLTKLNLLVFLAVHSQMASVYSMAVQILKLATNMTSEQQRGRLSDTRAEVIAALEELLAAVVSHNPNR